jgi:hypothetical protein
MHSTEDLALNLFLVFLNKLQILRQRFIPLMQAPLSYQTVHIQTISQQHLILLYRVKKHRPTIHSLQLRGFSRVDLRLDITHTTHFVQLQNTLVLVQSLEFLLLRRQILFRLIRRFIQAVIMTPQHLRSIVLIKVLMCKQIIMFKIHTSSDR